MKHWIGLGYLFLIDYSQLCSNSTVPKPKSYIPITDKIREKLFLYEKQTGMGNHRIARYVQKNKLIPDGITLTYVTVQNWKSGIVKSANEQSLYAVLDAYEALINGEGDTSQMLLPMTDELIKKLERHFKKTKYARQAMLSNGRGLKGFNNAYLSSLTTGRRETVRADILQFLETYLKNYQENEKIIARTKKPKSVTEIQENTPTPEPDIEHSKEMIFRKSPRKKVTTEFRNKLCHHFETYPYAKGFLLMRSDLPTGINEALMNGVTSGKLTSLRVQHVNYLNHFIDEWKELYPNLG